MKNSVVAFAKLAMLLSFLGISGSAGAEDARSRLPQMSVKLVVPVQSPVVDCTCRYQGIDFQLGEAACIRGQRAVCGRVLNNTSWEFSNDGCLFSSQLNVDFRFSG